MIFICRHVLSVLVQNQSGVLSKIAGLFTRRGYNIDSLSVGETDNPKISRMTIVVNCDNSTLEQIQKQLHKQIDVIKIIHLKNNTSICKELVMIKINANPDQRGYINDTVNMFKSKIIDVASNTLTVEITGDEQKISAFIKIIKPLGIIELVRTGFTGLQRGDI
ncbi:acetolactate synthase small subunit [Tepidibacter sp. Z1-5]|uniref:acetolactate synthase small subunit n=1 Tax=Tepidibacter sp. Z1-5 TaxID=3134138 RepID=UPI0030BDBCA5